MNCAIYIRKSRDEAGKDHHRLTVQRRQLPNYATSQGWTKIIYDEGHASAARGKSDSLPERNRLESDIKSGKIDIILTIELSRLSRDDTGMDFHRWIALCTDYNVKLATLDRVLDPNDPTDRTMLRITDTMSAGEMLWLAKRMREGREEAIRAGKYISGNPPSPYYHDKAEGGLLVDPQQLEEVNAILALAETTSARQIAKQTGKAEITIRRMLSDDRLLMYQAKRLDPETGEEISGQWPAIIDAEQAERVRSGRRTRKNGGTPKQYAALLSNLGGLLQCGYCGKTVKTWRNSRIKKDGTRNNYYGCTTNCRKSRLVQQQIIDDKVITNLLGTLGNAEELKAAWLQHTTNNDTSNQQLADLDQEENELKTKKSRLIAAITDGIIDFADAKETRIKLDNTLSGIQIRRKQIHATKQTEPDWQALQIGHDNWHDMTTDERREFIRRAIDSIRIYNTYALIQYPFSQSGAARIHLPEPYKTPTRGKNATSRK